MCSFSRSALEVCASTITVESTLQPGTHSSCGPAPSFLLHAGAFKAGATLGRNGATTRCVARPQTQFVSRTTAALKTVAAITVSSAALPVSCTSLYRPAPSFLLHAGAFKAGATLGRNGATTRCVARPQTQFVSRTTAALKTVAAITVSSAALPVSCTSLYGPAPSFLFHAGAFKAGAALVRNGATTRRLAQQVVAVVLLRFGIFFLWRRL